jgi:hypothetical protein
MTARAAGQKREAVLRLESIRAAQHRLTLGVGLFALPFLAAIVWFGAMGMVAASIVAACSVGVSILSAQQSANLLADVTDLLASMRGAGW